VTDDVRPIDELYFEWLYKNYIGAISNPNPDRGYWKLALYLHKRQFTWPLRDDHNRAEDGIAIRDQFITDCDIQDVEIGWLQEECSVLEMLIGLACRASFASWGEPGDWFWKFLRNLELADYNDRIYNSTIEKGVVDVVISRLLDRTYGRNGDGGLFPCNNATTDQAQVPLWAQLQHYLLEGNYLEHGP
jgi:hypothetical protein